MALSFLPDSDLTLDVVVTCDPAVVATEEQAQAYLVSGDMNELGGYEGDLLY